MTYQRLMNIITTSQMCDWNEVIIGNDIYQSYCLLDVNIRIVDDLNYGVINDFSENWAISGFDHAPIKHDISLFYGNTCIKIVPVVRINRANAFVPFPVTGTQIIDPVDYHIAKKGVHANNDLDVYIRKCNLSLQQPQQQ